MTLKVAVITGASSGLGLHTAKKLFKTGNYKLVLACRSEQKTQAAIDEITRAYPDQNSGLIKFLQLDLTSRRSIHKFVDDFKTNFDGLDLLINNAGVMNHPHQLTGEGIEVHFATNHVGHWILTQELLGQLKQGARIIIVTSGLYKNASVIPPIEDFVNLKKVSVYKPNMLYSISKLANCLYTTYLEDYFKEQSDSRLKTVQVFAIRPGFIRGTELGRHTPWILRTLAAPLIWLIAKDLDQGVAGILHCSTAEDDKLVSGRLYFGETQEKFEDSVTLDKAALLQALTEDLVDRTSEGNEPHEPDASGDH